MEDAVRQLLISRGVSLALPTYSTHAPGFSLLGIAERVPEFGEIRGEPVNVWHVQSDLFPVSMAEFERWIVDAPHGRHWLLSERKLPENFGSLIPKESEIVVWGPNKMSVWLGEAILSGDLKVAPKELNQKEVNVDSGNVVTQNHDLSGVVEPIVDIDSWLVQRGYDGALTYPVLLNCKLWEVEGEIVSPSGKSEGDLWMILEDPWASTVSIFEGFDNPSSPPSLRVLDPPSSRWKGAQEMLSVLPTILDVRRQGETEDEEGSVRSIMLEWWRLDTTSAKMRPNHIGLPAWVVRVAGRDDAILHGMSGRTFPIA
tara:strand:- start:20114 stop:21055 length:942 start_codon:yes stop_codon:yes gene_type:complete